jgi:hypothetical protein
MVVVGVGPLPELVVVVSGVVYIGVGVLNGCIRYCWLKFLVCR